MRILVISQYWEPENGVPQRRWAWLAEVLRANGHEVAVVAPPPHYPTGVLDKNWTPVSSELGAHGERIFRSNFRPHGRGISDRVISQAYIAASTLRQAVGIIRRRDFVPDVVIGTVPAIPSAIVARIVAFFSNAGLVIDLRDAWPELLHNSSEWNSSLHKKSSWKDLVKQVIKVPVIHATSLAMTSVLKNSSGVIVTASALEVPNEHRFIVRNVFPSPVLKEFRIDRQTLHEEGSLRILYGGTLGRAQDLDNALVAFQLLQAVSPRSEMHIVGGGVAKKSLQQFCEQHQLNVKFYERAPLEEMEKHYEWADTALVHLANWPALAKAVPSKTYELMEIGIHISGVVNGEAKAIISELDAGATAAPGVPEELAAVWMNILSHGLNHSPAKARSWIQHQRSSVAVEQLLSAIELANRSS